MRLEGNEPWEFLGLRGSVRLRALRDGRVARRSLIWRMQSFEKCDERRGLRRTQILRIRRHVAASLDDLPDQLVGREAGGNAVQSRPPLPSCLTEGMAIAALFDLKDECASPLQ